MTDDAELPSTRQILEGDAANRRDSQKAASKATESADDESFRRVMTALRAVLQMRGS